MTASSPRTWYEFFAGGGMARLGLGSNWHCTFANDISEKKASSYREHFGPSEELSVTDVAALRASDLPGRADLVWASFPCQDLSLAGSGAGLDGTRSGAFRPFWKLMESLEAERRAPKVIVLENVTGTLTSHGGQDFSSIIRAFADIGYAVGALVIDASRFLPQSRQRLFVVGTRRGAAIPPNLTRATPTEPFHRPALIKAYDKLPVAARKSWIWWNLPAPNTAVSTLSSIIEDDPSSVSWHSASETARLLKLMSPAHRKLVENLVRLPGRHVGTVYKRMRPNRNGERVQRAEVRFDGVSGCLRTPTGGSSRQTVLLVEDGRVKSRLLSTREAARLMGVPDNYPLPLKYNDAYHLFGDGVVVPVVSWLRDHLLAPLTGTRSFEQVA
jgi:DNA (cytosine-5)-methyltransferase 1